jgi:hypothetical protein
LPARRRLRLGRLALPPLGFFAVLLLVILGAFAGNSSRQGGSSSPSAAALAGIPADYLVLYRQAGASYGLDWAVLAAIGAVESNHGRSSAAGVRSGLNSAGCCAGPMPFNLSDGPPSGWAIYATDGNNDGHLNPYDPADAIAAARLLRANGAPADYAAALFAYNHAGWYVDQVLHQASRYRASLSPASSTPLPIPPADSSAAALLAHPGFSSANPAWTSFDLQHGLVDPRLTALLLTVLEQHQLSVWVFKSGHSILSDDGNVSNHSYGRAVDIATVDGQACNGSASNACAQLAIQLTQVHGPLRLSELIYCFDPDALSADSWAQADHCDHIHAGYKATPPIDA